MGVTALTEIEAPSDRDLCLFLSKYSAWLMGSGATCIRVEKNVKRIARAYGREVELYIMPKHVHIYLWHEGSTETVNSIATVNHTAISFNINTQLSQLSWAIADGKTNFSDACRQFKEIVYGDRQNKWMVLALVGVANASFCRLFGGDIAAMAIVFVATIVGYLLKLEMMKRHIDFRVIVLVCSFISALIASAAVYLPIEATIGIAVGTSVLYLVPGIPFLNSFSDLLYRHYICSFSRFTDALVLTCCLSIGIFAGMSIMHLNMF